MAQKNRIPHQPPVVVTLLSYCRAMVLSIAVGPLLALASAAPAGAGQVTEQAGENRRLVLFGAHWCAPCMAEYRSLPDIVAAAHPNRVVLAWIDEPIQVPAALAGKIEALPTNEARRLATRLLGEGYGLPSAVVLGTREQACAIVRAPLRESLVRSMLDRCGSAKQEAN